MMSNFDENERLIARYKELYRLGEMPISHEDGLDLLRIITTLVERGFRLTGEGEDWLPPFTPDAG
jgi:hypothetical protein